MSADEATGPMAATARLALGARALATVLGPPLAMLMAMLGVWYGNRLPPARP